MWSADAEPTRVQAAELDGFSAIPREEWSRLRFRMPADEGAASIEYATAAWGPIPRDEVENVYRPLAHLISLHVASARSVARATDAFVGRPASACPFVLGVAGSVAAGKSTVARLLQTLLAESPEHPRVDRVSTDGFLLPQAELQRRGLMRRKGFPETYDVRGMIAFMAELRSTGRAAAPVYSHESYDIVPGQEQLVDRPDIVIVEGLNVLQGGTPAVTDFLDLSLYVDAAPEHIQRWFLDRFMTLMQERSLDPGTHLHSLASAFEDEVRAFALSTWNEINLPNLVQNILPTRSRADIVISKGADHRVAHVCLR